MELRPADKKKETLLREIISREINGPITAVHDLSFGYYGHVYRVGLAGASDVVVKIIEAESEEDFDRESSDDRVYGGRWSNLRPAYSLLRSGSVPVPQLYAVGQLEDVQYSIMGFVEGESVREFLAHGNHERLAELYGVAGEWTGKLHRITREFQGWVDMKHPYKKDWQSAFFESFTSRLDGARRINQFVQAHIEEINRFKEGMNSKWDNPRQFVLSHTDGFQGMAKYESGQWQLTGIIDIEDHQFTDPRFVLAGQELSLEYENRSMPPLFWDEYRKHSELDPNYHLVKNLFKSYYLLSWLPVVQKEQRGSESEQMSATRRLEKLLLHYVEQGVNSPDFEKAS